jgi:hypothetical protein
VHERRDDAVGGAGDPARIGGAPEDVVGVQVERRRGGRVVRHYRAMHVHRPFRHAGGAAREVQERGVFRSGAFGLELARERVQVSGFNANHVLERRHLCRNLLHLALVERLGGDEHLAAAEVDARLERLGAERREKRRYHGAALERAEHRGVKLGNAAAQHEHYVALGDAETAQQVGEAIGEYR